MTMQPWPRRTSGRKAWIIATGPKRLTSSWVKIGHGLELEGSWRDAGVVDEPGKAAVADGVADDGHGGRDGLGIGDFDDDRRHLARRLRNKGLAVLFTTHAGEDVKAVSARCFAVAAPMPVDVPVTTTDPRSVSRSLTASQSGRRLLEPGLQVLGRGLVDLRDGRADRIRERPATASASECS